MCLSIPAKIISIDSTNPALRMAKVLVGEVISDVCIEWVPEAELGDYVLVHVGTALSMVDEESALKSIETYKEMEELLNKEKNS